MKRRTLLAGLVAAPAIVTAGNIMRINPKLIVPPQEIATPQPARLITYQTSDYITVYNTGDTRAYMGYNKDKLKTTGMIIEHGGLIDAPAILVKEMHFSS